ncbi:CDP-glycerol glycerophosphotransferase family protein [Microbacterium sp. SLBN-146]|uniref:CDP-glycerol glycerophosphotransferase family protein n=1 Tax=Microbacterium sp. SLBN-146 TaxID=2768457 RepID=UPI0011547375|nr:CDP-glycerol glycerophosphotransferase family protein [Microbacterium sp. SLBN-146]TQJ31790.1 CDP-glycerol glycerophosphotransferase [Microbacterium sp. SLBN-146]
MASFSFGVGNARKLAALPLYVAGRIATLLIPRSRDEWVFGCGAGIGDGALALWDEAARDGRTAVWLVGSARERADAESRGIRTVAKMSLAGFWRTARARVIVVTHGFGDVNRYAVSGGFIVQLWHGIPLKRIGLDSPETLRVPARWGRLAPLARRALGVLYAQTTRQIRILPAASHLVRGRLESAFSLSDPQVPVTGEPRVDVLSQGDPAQRQADARAAVAKILSPVGVSRLLLYAPTWRDGDPDPAIPTTGEWQAILAALERHDAILVVRSHPLGAGEYSPTTQSDRVRSLGSDLAADITPLLPAFSALITDYSSLAFDATLVPLPLVFLAPDVEAYSRRRGFYGAYHDVAGEDVAMDWMGAVSQLEAVLDDPGETDRRLERSRALSERVHAFRDGGNTTRVYRTILAGLARDQAKGRR